jgi:hypothetical protein
MMKKRNIAFSAECPQSGRLLTFAGRLVVYFHQHVDVKQHEFTSNFISSMSG